jgi:hypothetical protein|tara:strand:- start:231 stop:407 length:177 start_codon:yes stop_codon:yes gene_type:complete
MAGNRMKIKNEEGNIIKRVMSLDKKGASTDYIIKWILAIAIITAVGFAIREIVSKFAG